MCRSYLPSFSHWHFTITAGKYRVCAVQKKNISPTHTHMLNYTAQYPVIALSSNSHTVATSQLALPRINQIKINWSIPDKNIPTMCLAEENAQSLLYTVLKQVSGQKIPKKIQLFIFQPTRFYVSATILQVCAAYLLRRSIGYTTLNTYIQSPIYFSCTLSLTDVYNL